MSTTDSTPAVYTSKTGDTAKPAKPHPDFPLFPHAARQWAKKIRGKLHYFGPWSDPDGALARYLEQKDALHAGRTPRPNAGEATVKDVCNAFLNAKQALVDAGELSPRSWLDYKQTAAELISHLGKKRPVSDLRPDDFASLRDKLSKRLGPHRLGNTIQRVRSIFKHAFDSELIASPVRFGPAFKRPSKKTVRVHRGRQGAKLFSAQEVRNLIGAAGPALRAMILLGINCGLGNSDCGHLPLSAVDLEIGSLDFPRPKTGVARRCPLWPETVKALRDYLLVRPEPKSAEHAGLVFITKQGQPWAKSEATGTNPTSAAMAKMLRALKINGRAGLNFYGLRHTHRTIADEAKDQPACDLIMGHESPHMSTIYRERISDGRLKAVVGHVRNWLLDAAGEGGG